MAIEHAMRRDGFDPSLLSTILDDTSQDSSSADVQQTALNSAAEEQPPSFSTQEKRTTRFPSHILADPQHLEEYPMVLTTNPAFSQPDLLVNSEASYLSQSQPPPPPGMDGHKTPPKRSRERDIGRARFFF